ncbi:MAG: hypothetical protein EAZ53_01155 [Bacteroidetes bacterium]|nr:MAG: hypothetical protein EAZ53_01155 [Bacteroidota bacterium]
MIRFVRFNQNGKVNENYFYYKDLAELRHNKLLTKSNIHKDFNIEIMKKQENFIFKKWKKVR